MSKKENRQYHRVPSSGPARISWEDNHGLNRFALAKCIDVSEAGLQIETSESLPVRSQISFRADRINLSGSATVRSVGWRGCKCVLGLNLSQTQAADVFDTIRAALS